jgi:hypothetical protein
MRVVGARRGAWGKDRVVAMMAEILSCRLQMADEVTRSGGKGQTTQQKRTMADDGKQRDLTAAGNERVRGGRRLHMQLINAYSNTFKPLWRAATIIVVITCIPIVVVVIIVMLQCLC